MGYLGFYFNLLFFATIWKYAYPATQVLYNTKIATSDMDWSLKPDNGWEELSSLDVDGSTIRSYQVCKVDEGDQDNWARSPYIDAKSAKRVYMDIEFSVMKCPNCRETFTLFYYPSSSNVASSTFPPWRENPYIKIDTVAAGERFDSSSAGPSDINKKTLVIGPLQRSGFYIAAQDQGACMSLMSIKLYYHYCAETTHNLAYFPKTVAGGEVASLISVEGKCVSNAVYSNNEVPKYRCNSNGHWKVATGMCECRAGFAPNKLRTSCEPCKVGEHKSAVGNHACSLCPAHSQARSVGSTHCTCVDGFYRAASDSINQPCTQTPSAPRHVDYEVDKFSAAIRWSTPLNNGGRNDIYYSIECEKCDVKYIDCQQCPSSVDFDPANYEHVTGRSMRISDLEPFSSYKIKITSHNGVSGLSEQPDSFKDIQFSTSDAVPSIVTGLVSLLREERLLTIQWEPATDVSGRVNDYEVVATAIKQAVNAPTSASAPVTIRAYSRNLTLVNLAPGTSYRVKVRARSDAGFGPFSEPVAFSTLNAMATPSPVAQESTGLIAGIIAGLVVILVLMLVVFFVRRRRERSLKDEEKRASSKLVVDSNEIMSGFGGHNTRKTYVDYRDPHKGVKEIAREIDAAKIRIERVIGGGEFGEVCKGKMADGNQNVPVAVKRLKHGASLIDQTNFLREACTMAQFHDPNIVQLKGVVTKSMPAMILTEFMENGSLDKFLKRKRGELSMLQTLKMLRGIASGMRYLSQMKYVHRDLAARNILVGSDLACKVSDFGLSRTLENDPHATYTTQGGKIALRWTAPECIRFRQFTSASDVWSFGIVMWEVMSYGEKPYWDMSNDDVTEVIEDGYRLPAPSDCPSAIHNLMLDCWSYESRRRPSFNDIINQLDQFIKQPSLLNDEENANESLAPLLNPDSPTSLEDVNTLEEWLDMVKLGRYRGSFYAHGINDLEKLAHINPSELERLGISSQAHRSRLQSGLDTLRHHMTAGAPISPNGAVIGFSNTMRAGTDSPQSLSAATAFTLPPPNLHRQMSRQSTHQVAMV